MNFLLAFAIVLAVNPLMADQVVVRHTEGRNHGFLVLRDLEDNILAHGDLSQSASGNRVTSELTLNFKDGSLYQETTVYSQRRVFQLLAHRLVQKARAFKRQMDMSLTSSTGRVTIRYSEEEGKEKNETDNLKLPADIANGMVPTLLANIDPKVAKTTLSMVVATPKPRVVKLQVSPLGEDSFSLAGAPRKAIFYNVKVDIGGVSGVIAPIIGKQPPDTRVWLIGGKVPGFLKLEGPLFEGGPVWRIELASPLWPKMKLQGRSRRPGSDYLLCFTRSASPETLSLACDSSGLSLSSKRE